MSAGALGRRFEPGLTNPVIAATALVVFFVVWWLSPRGLNDLAAVALAIGGATLTAVLVPRAPLAAIGVVFFLSSLSLVEIPLPVGSMRLEQPAIAVLLVTVWGYRDRLELAAVRPVAPILIAGAIYLGVSALSSAIVAPEPVASLRVAAWTAISMLGGLAAYLLSARAQSRLFDWFAGSGLFMAIAGLTAAVAFYLFGPGTPGVMGPMSGNPKVQAFAWEANLYASLICATAFFALERFRQDRNLVWGAVVALTLAGIGVGITRGAYIGLFAGLAIYAAVVWRRLGVRRIHAVLGVTVLIATAVGMIIGAILMDVSVRNENVVERGQAPPTKPAVRDELGTLDYRLVRIGPALNELRASPIIGLGLASFGQRHTTNESGEPDYLNIMAVSTLYDSGIVGALALAAIFIVVLIRLWRTSRDPARAGPAAAYLGALVTLLIAYQATNAIHFALNWLIVGAALGLTVAERPPARERDPGATAREPADARAG